MEGPETVAATVPTTAVDTRRATYVSLPRQFHSGSDAQLAGRVVSMCETKISGLALVSVDFHVESLGLQCGKDSRLNIAVDS